LGGPILSLPERCRRHHGEAEEECKSETTVKGRKRKGNVLDPRHSGRRCCSTPVYQLADRRKGGGHGWCVLGFLLVRADLCSLDDGRRGGGPLTGTPGGAEVRGAAAVPRRSF